MADLTDLQSAITSKIAGAGPSTGIETFFADVDSNGSLKVADISNNGGSAGAITVGTSAVLASVSGTNLTNRRFLGVHNNGSTTIYWGTTSGVTTSSGTPIAKGQFISWAVGPNTNIYLISGSAGQNIRVTELA